MANSKLSATEKVGLKQFKAENPEITFFSFRELGVTVGIRMTGKNMADFAVSIASGTETKFRRKVGEFHVAKRFYDSVYLPVKINSREQLESVAESIAYSVTRR